MLSQLKRQGHAGACLFTCTEAMKTPGCCKGVSCTAAVWNILSVQTEDVQQLRKSSGVWGGCWALGPSGEGADMKPYGAQFRPMERSFWELLGRFHGDDIDSLHGDSLEGRALPTRESLGTGVLLPQTPEFGLHGNNCWGPRSLGVWLGGGTRSWDTPGERGAACFHGEGRKTNDGTACREDGLSGG